MPNKCIFFNIDLRPYRLLAKHPQNVKKYIFVHNDVITFSENSCLVLQEVNKHICMQYDFLVVICVKYNYMHHITIYVATFSRLKF